MAKAIGGDQCSKKVASVNKKFMDWQIFDLVKMESDAINFTRTILTRSSTVVGHLMAVVAADPQFQTKRLLAAADCSLVFLSWREKLF
jgi:hypothetical protein